MNNCEYCNKKLGIKRGLLNILGNIQGFVYGIILPLICDECYCKRAKENTELKKTKKEKGSATHG